MYNGYDFYMAGMKLPFAPPSMTITVGSKNETIDLINEGEVNILKSPSLVEVEFTARIPMRTYPYAPQVNSFDEYYATIKKLKESKEPFDFIVVRMSPDGSTPSWDTNLKMALESFTFNEDWEEGDDVLIDFELKQYKAYGTKTAKVKTDSSGNATVNKTTDNSRVEKTTEQSTYKVENGDCLWNIAKAAYGDGSKWTVIYDANKSTIEDAAKSHGKSSSSNGHWIWAGTELVIPDSSTADLNVSKLSSNSTSSSTSSTNSKGLDPQTAAFAEKVKNAGGGAGTWYNQFQ